VQIVLIAACVTAIAFLIWRFAPRYLSSRRGKKKPKREARIVLGERLEPDQTAADLLAQAEALARSGDLRAAIRKAYIALLCELGDRKVVSLAQHKTNRDYLNSVREKTRLYSFMRQLTSSFELHWYGFQPAAENDWNEFRNVYQQALKASPGG
jgi:type II secretory pathway component HofQ